MSAPRIRLLKKYGWKRLGIGFFNKAKVHKGDKIVFKAQQRPYRKNMRPGEQSIRLLDTPERSVELWNTINPTRATAELANLPFYSKKMGKWMEIYGWICPFIEGRKISHEDDKETRQKDDTAISKALIDIFTRTGRIIVDATNRNFIEATNGEMVCIDIGLAINLRIDEAKSSPATETKSPPHSTRSRAKSESNPAWQTLKDYYDTEYFRDHEPYYPKSTNTIKALLFIATNCPDITDARFLESERNPTLIDDLAIAYDGKVCIDDALANLKKALISKDDNPDIDISDPDGTDKTDISEVKSHDTMTTLSESQRRSFLSLQKKTTTYFEKLEDSLIKSLPSYNDLSEDSKQLFKSQIREELQLADEKNEVEKIVERQLKKINGNTSQMPDLEQNIDLTYKAFLCRGIQKYSIEPDLDKARYNFQRYIPKGADKVEDISKTTLVQKLTIASQLNYLVKEYTPENCKAYKELIEDKRNEKLFSTHRKFCLEVLAFIFSLIPFIGIPRAIHSQYKYGTLDFTKTAGSRLILTTKKDLLIINPEQEIKKSTYSQGKRS